jgi:predicted lysophospholipase L1 biosynthesis ABC-type transport system permease subunit
MLPQPPEELVRKTVPILAKIVGVSFIVGGAFFLTLGIVLLFVHKENTTLIGAVFVGGSIFNIALGVVVVRYVPKWMLGIFEKLRH